MTTPLPSWPHGRARPAGAWTANNAVALFVTHVLAVGAVTGGWYGASVTAHPFDQVPWLVLATSGVVASAFCGLVWLLNGRRAIGQRLRAVAGDIVVTDAASVPAASARQNLGHARDQVVAGDRMSYYHRPSCLLTSGKALAGMTAASQVAAGRRPCPICQP